jgi:hypothetical protein
MRGTAKDNWLQLRNGKSGTRFRDYYEFRRRRRSGPAARIITLVIAILLIGGGLAISWLPGPGGFVAIIGLALLAQEFRPLAWLLDQAEVFVRGLWRRFTRLSPLPKAGIIFMCAAAAGGAIYVASLLLRK